MGVNLCFSESRFGGMFADLTCTHFNAFFTVSQRPVDVGVALASPRAKKDASFFIVVGSCVLICSAELNQRSVLPCRLNRDFLQLTHRLFEQ